MTLTAKTITTLFKDGIQFAHISQAKVWSQFGLQFIHVRFSVCLCQQLILQSSPHLERLWSGNNIAQLWTFGEYSIGITIDGVSTDNASRVMLAIDCWMGFLGVVSVRESYDDVIKWKHFLSHWLFVRGIHLSPVNSRHNGQWRRALIFFLIFALNKRPRKQSWGRRRFETPSRSLWRHCNVNGCW